MTAIEGRFKLGKDERRPVFEASLRDHPGAALVRWMRCFDCYSDEPHWFHGAGHQRDVQERVLRWYEDHLKRGTAADRS